MSNLSQFLSTSNPIGSIQSFQYQGDLYTDSNGIQWYALTGTAPFAYTSSYSYLPDNCLSPHPIFNGPEPNGLWFFSGQGVSIAFNPSSGLYVTAAYSGNSVIGYRYFTSSDGINWTQRSFPNSVNYNLIQYTANKFVAVGSSTGTNNIIHSTDGINWTLVSVPSMTPTEIVSDGSNRIFVSANAPDANLYSANGGTTWSVVTTPTIVNFNNLGVNGSGNMTYNTGAGLFIAASNQHGAYMTSSTGANNSWTLRSTQTTYALYTNKFIIGTKYASSPTTTVAFGLGGFVATSTDGLTWTNYGYVSSTLDTTLPSIAYYDGTRFVVKYVNRIFYSSNGTTWVEGKFPGGSSSNVFPISSNGRLFLPVVVSPNGSLTKMLICSNVTSTSKTTIISSADHSSNIVGDVNYIRIR